MSIIFIVLIFIVVVLIALHFASKKFGSAVSDESLYQRLGGIYPIADVVNDFSDNLVKNPIVGQGSPNQFLNDWSTNKLNRLAGLKFMRTLWVASLAGGPFEFSPSSPDAAGKCPFSLENAHRQFDITSEEFDEVAAELRRSIESRGVGPRERDELLAAFSAHKGDVVDQIASCS